MANKQCDYCGKLCDPSTRLCPTPDRCASLKGGKRRIDAEERAIERRARSARIESEAIGIDVSRVKAPPDRVPMFRRAG